MVDILAIAALAFLFVVAWAIEDRIDDASQGDAAPSFADVLAEPAPDSERIMPLIRARSLVTA